MKHFLHLKNSPPEAHAESPHRTADTQSRPPLPAKPGTREKRSASTFWLWPRANKRARHSGTVKKTNLWCGSGAKQRCVYFLLVFCFAPQPRLKIFFGFVFHTALLACHACCTSVVACFFSLRGYGLPTHNQKVPARAYGRLFVLRGGSGGGHAHCSCAPCTAAGSPAPPHACRGRALTHE
jgi:hypothetical protein